MLNYSMELKNGLSHPRSALNFTSLALSHPGIDLSEELRTSPTSFELLLDSFPLLPAFHLDSHLQTSTYDSTGRGQPNPDNTD